MFKSSLTEEIIRRISKIKKEANWLLDFRLKAFLRWQKMNLPKWGPDLSQLDLSSLSYYEKSAKPVNKWEDFPPEIKKTYDDLGLPEAEKKYLAGISAQYESEVMYKSISETLTKKGVIFTDIETGAREYPEIFKKFFSTLVSSTDNFFACLNAAVFSGGVFLYAPRNVKVELPLQAYFRINRQRLGQFERTLIIAEPGSSVHYIEGCSAPIYDTDSLHAGVVEVFVMDEARVRYTTVQNWSKNIYNLVTKRAIVEKSGSMQWLDGNLGAKVTMKYPSTILKGDYAKGEMLSLSLASNNQIQSTGAKMIHIGRETTSKILSKSVTKQAGVSVFNGMIKIHKGAVSALAKSSCDSLIFDDQSQVQATPFIDVQEKTANVTHEATVSRLDNEKIEYLESRGISKERSEGLLVNGFLDNIMTEIPFEFAIELNRLINLEFKKNL